MPDVMDQAKALVGTEAPRDWQLRPREHAASLGGAGGALKKILTRPDIEEIIETYEVADAAAGRSRTIYKRLATSSAFASFAAIVIAGILLLAHARLLETHANLALLSIVQGTLLILSFLVSNFIAIRRPFDRWMRERAGAEHHRAALFNRVMQAGQDTAAGELPILPLKLEYFRRYQLDVQRKYYSERGREHARAMKRATLLRWLATLLLAAAGIPVIAGAAGMDWHAWITKLGLPDWVRDGDLQQRLFLALSTIGAALQGLLAATLLINQDERNASRYAATAENLEALASRPLDEARKAAAEGDEDAVAAFVALVQEQISSEHREWVSLRAIVPSLSLARLREANLPWAGTQMK